MHEACDGVPLELAEVRVPRVGRCSARCNRRGMIRAPAVTAATTGESSPPHLMGLVDRAGGWCRRRESEKRRQVVDPDGAVFADLSRRRWHVGPSPAWPSHCHGLRALAAKPVAEPLSSQEFEEVPLTIVGGFDVHRWQLLFDYVDSVTGEIARGRIAPADQLELRAWLSKLEAKVATSPGLHRVPLFERGGRESRLCRSCRRAS